MPAPTPDWRHARPRWSGDRRRRRRTPAAIAANPAADDDRGGRASGEQRQRVTRLDAPRAARHDEAADGDVVGGHQVEVQRHAALEMVGARRRWSTSAPSSSAARSTACSSRLAAIRAGRCSVSHRRQSSIHGFSTRVRAAAFARRRSSGWSRARSHEDEARRRSARLARLRCRRSDRDASVRSSGR